MSSKSKRRVGRPSKFPPEFRRDAVAMVLDERRSTADSAAVLAPSRHNYQLLDPPVRATSLHSISKEKS